MMELLSSNQRVKDKDEEKDCAKSKLTTEDFLHIFNLGLKIFGNN